MPKVVDHESYRTELLARAFELFASLGYEATTMRRLASELGVSTGTLYHYFKTKDDIFEQMVRYVAERDVLDVATLIPLEADSYGRLDFLIAWVRANQDHLASFLLLALDFQRHTKKERGHPVIRDGLQQYRDAINLYMGIKDRAVARIIFEAFVGFVVTSILDPENVDHEKLKRDLRNGLRPPPSGS